MTIKQRLEELRFYQKQLKRYCHGSNKCDINRCPEQCKCRRKLDLDTAIAWRAAIHMQAYFDTFENLQKLRNLLKDYRYTLRYHSDKYHKLNKIICQIRILLFK